MVASNVHISLSCVVCFIVFIHGLFHFLVPFNVLFIFIYFHLCSFMFIYFHLYSFMFIYFHVFLFMLISFHFFSCPVFFSLEKTITNLNHLHVDPQLSSADYKQWDKPPINWCRISLAHPQYHHQWRLICKMVDGQTPGPGEKNMMFMGISLGKFRYTLW